MPFELVESKDKKRRRRGKKVIVIDTQFLTYNEQCELLEGLKKREAYFAGIAKSISRTPERPELILDWHDSTQEAMIRAMLRQVNDELIASTPSVDGKPI